MTFRNWKRHSMPSRSSEPRRRGKRLCADAGYIGSLRWRPLSGMVTSPMQRLGNARRWVVEVAHGWFNRFRKLPARYELLDRSFIALNHLAASIIAFREVKLA
jgi:putative transposase